jgi:hypothetical protein
VHVEEVLARVVRASPLEGHDGRSGARIERAELEDGRTVIVKRTDAGRDIAMTVSDDSTGRERRLWADGVLDRLPPGVGHAVLAAGWQEDELVTCMLDLGERVLTWNDRLSPSELERLFGALAAMHGTFEGDTPEGLWDLEGRLGMLSPRRVRDLPEHHDLRSAVMRGWERFGDLVRDDVARPVFSALEDPTQLVTTFRRAPATLMHADAWLVNVALCPETVVLLDWNLATAGPGLLDAVMFAFGCASHVDLPREGVVAAARRWCGGDVDDQLWQAALFWALCDMGWNKALDAADHPDQAQRAYAGAELDWWVARAASALDAGAVL